MANIPILVDICQFLKPILEEKFSGISLDVILNTCNGVSNNEATLNELFNFVLAFYNGLSATTDFNQWLNFANDTFTNYTKQWVPFQYGTLIVTIIVIVMFLSLSGYIEYPMAVLISIGSAAFLAVIAVVQLSILDDFVNERETTLNGLISDIISHITDVAGPDAFTAYFNASQLNINNGINSGLKKLTDPTVVTTISPPYYKLLIIHTETPSSTTLLPAIYDVFLSGENVNFRLQNAIPIYVMNANPYNKSTFGSFISSTDPPDSGIINLTNAFTPFNATSDNVQLPKVNMANISSSGNGIGVLIYPGEVKCFINAGVNKQAFPGTQEISQDTWVEVTSDVRPFVQKLTYTSNGSLLPTHRIENVFAPEGTTITIDNDYGYDGQELIIVANITPADGEITITSNRSPLEGFFPKTMTNLQKMTLQFQRTAAASQAGSGWILISGPN